WLVLQHFIEQRRTPQEAVPHVGIEQVDENGIRKTLSQKGAFSRLARSKEKNAAFHILIKTANSVIHHFLYYHKLKNTVIYPQK
ncbi:MAG: hypothetical protein Q4B68_08930, partial [Bacteroidales bacterium]|nr:hypothetical protein [Bacteroidales bacterium]